LYFIPYLEVKGVCGGSHRSTACELRVSGAEIGAIANQKSRKQERKGERAWKNTVEREQWAESAAHNPIKADKY